MGVFRVGVVVATNSNSSQTWPLPIRTAVRQSFRVLQSKMLRFTGF